MTVSTKPSLREFTNLQVRTVVFCFVLNMLDGADVLVVSYAAPLLNDQWAISPETLGVLFSAGLVGMTAGALGLAPLSDVVGRKTMILFATFTIATGMIVSSFASSIDMLIGLRLWVGLGIGAMLASIMALASEYAPPAFRSLAVTIATAGYPLGATATGFAANEILPVFGWPGLFLAVGLLSAVMFPLCLFFMPESVDFLLARRPANGIRCLNRIRAMTGLEPLSTLPDAAEPPSKRSSIRRLLDVEFRRSTLLVWGAFFAAFMTLYFLTSWIPKIAVDAGLAMEDAIFAGAAFNMGAFVGLVLLGWISARIGLTTMIAGFFALATVFMVVFGAFHSDIVLLYGEIFAIGFFVQGGFGGLYAVATRVYPASVRTTGVGWAVGMGRLGAVLGPYLGGLIIGWGVDLFGTFLIFAGPTIAAGVLIAILGGDRLENASEAAIPQTAQS